MCQMLSAMCALLALCLPSCSSPSASARLVHVNDQLQRRVDELERQVSQCKDQLRSMEGSQARLSEFGENRQVALFAPVSLEIASLTGGDNYDSKPGDDGITVYLRPLDADSNVVKAPGRIRIQLLDNSDLANPRLVHVCEVSDPEELKKAWHGRFLTNHYTLKCPFPADAVLPTSGELLVTVSFIDFLTGRELKADKVVTFAAAPAARSEVGARP